MAALQHQLDVVAAPYDGLLVAESWLRPVSQPPALEPGAP